MHKYSFVKCFFEFFLFFLSTRYPRQKNGRGAKKKGTKFFQKAYSIVTVFSFEDAKKQKYSSKLTKKQ